MTDFTPEETRYLEAYQAAMHAVMTGISYTMNFDKNEVDPKHMRTGVNSAHVSISALAELLIEKGVIAREEFYKSLVRFAEQERDMYQKRIQEKYPDTKITIL